MNKNTLNITLFIFLMLFSTAFIEKDNDIPQPEELGKVQWLRDYDKAIAQSEKTKKPVLILFQEVPGCHTCRSYGNEVLSHPMIVEAIEDLFIPLAIHNNKGGKDKKILESFGEPSWNNPVVRIINTDRKALTPRINGKYDRRSLVEGMVNALNKAGSEVPDYLQLLKEHLIAKSGNTEQATFGMYCFWSGEAKLGNIAGVVDSEPGFMGNSEVVSVTFNPEIISYDELVTAANKKKAFDRIFTYSSKQQKSATNYVNHSEIKKAKKFRADGQPKYYLLHSPYRLLPLLPNQAGRINTAIGFGGDPNRYLSPQQLKMLAFMESHPTKGWKNVYEKSFLIAWEQVQRHF